MRAIHVGKKLEELAAADPLGNVDLLGEITKTGPSLKG